MGKVWLHSHTLCCPSGWNPIIICPQDTSLILGHFCSRLQPRTEALLGALVSKRVDCREALLSVWETEDKCEDLVCSDFSMIRLAFSLFNLVFLCLFVFFYLCSFIVCILPVVTWSHASRSSQKLASNMKAHTWSELCRSTDFPLHQQKPSSHWFSFCLLRCIHNTTTLPLHSFEFSILYLWLVQFFSDQKIF